MPAKNRKENEMTKKVYEWAEKNKKRLSKKEKNDKRGVEEPKDYEINGVEFRTEMITENWVVVIHWKMISVDKTVR